MNTETLRYEIYYNGECCYIDSKIIINKGERIFIESTALSHKSNPLVNFPFVVLCIEHVFVNQNDTPGLMKYYTRLYVEPASHIEMEKHERSSMKETLEVIDDIDKEIRDNIEWAKIEWAYL
jgi:hypothetical protein